MGWAGLAGRQLAGDLRANDSDFIVFVSLVGHRTECSLSPVPTLPYRRMRLHAGGAVVV